MSNESYDPTFLDSTIRTIEKEYMNSTTPYAKWQWLTQCIEMIKTKDEIIFNLKNDITFLEDKIANKQNALNKLIKEKHNG